MISFSLSLPSTQIPSMEEGVGVRTKGGGPEEFTNGQTERPLIHRRECRKHIRRPISKSQEGNTGSGLAESEVIGDRRQVGAKEIRGDNPNERKEEREQEEVSERNERFGNGGRRGVPVAIR